MRLAWESFLTSPLNQHCMKSLFLLLAGVPARCGVLYLPLLLCFASAFLPRQTDDFIDPTGTYILKGEVHNNHITGHYGELRVSLINETTAAFCFYINKGFPDYASGAFMDTLSYENNMFKYHSRRDTGCSVVMMFKVQTAELMELYTDPHSQCGFAPGVMAPVTLWKISGEKPIIQDLSGRGEGLAAMD